MSQTPLAIALCAAQQRVVDYLSQQISAMPSNDTKLQQAMLYSLTNGGKRARPFLIYTTGQMLGLPLSSLDPLAAAMEAVHCYSLVHDDLPAMDDDDLRRGKPTCHIAFDEATAILAGDALQSFAFSLLSGAQTAELNADARLAVISEFAKAAGYLGMCGGQAMDIAATDKAVSIEHLEQIHRLKTGALIRAAVTMPALAANANAEVIAILDQYADAVGLAFQVQDDILDIISDTATLGKQQGADLALNKSTYPSLLGLTGAQQKAAQLHQQALHSLTLLPYNTELLAEFATYIITRDF